MPCVRLCGGAVQADEPVDRKPEIEQECHKPCTSAWANYEACKERIAAKGTGSCEPWAFDYWRCVDKCVRFAASTCARLLSNSTHAAGGACGQLPAPCTRYALRPSMHGCHARVRFASRRGVPACVAYPRAARHARLVDCCTRPLRHTACDTCRLPQRSSRI
ncbi:hypothetical protein EON67_09255 [archaeon]|nr:MAG: hypothetical protein EON67_09255 [archaeon]